MLPAFVHVAGLGDRALATPLTAGVLGGHQTEIRADAGAGEPFPVADLHCEGERGQCRHSAQALQPRYHRCPFWFVRHLGDRFVQTIAT
jgi:hypothetical protein